MPERSAVLIITNHEDPAHASFVCAALDVISHPYLRLNCDDFPSGPARLGNRRGRKPSDDLASGRVWLNLESDPARSYVQRGAQRLALDDIRTVWFRRPRRGKIPSTIRGDTAAFALQASDEALDALYLELGDRLWVNPPWRQRRLADNKWYQMREAAKLGLRVPDTLVTSDPVAARDFYRRHPAGVVFKPTRTYIRGDDPLDTVSVWVSPIEEKHLENDDLFAHSPVCLQEHIAKAYELRVTVIGREMFAIKLDSQRVAESKIDWRRGSLGGALGHENVELPTALASALSTLMSRLGLVFGAFDIIVTPSGEYVFLEVNPSGQWLWCEYATGVPLLQSFVRLLIGGQDDPALYHRVPAYDLRELDKRIDDPPLQVVLPKPLERLKRTLGRWRYPSPAQLAAALARVEHPERPGGTPAPTASDVRRLLRLIGDRAPSLPSDELVDECLRCLAHADEKARGT